jgi:hypothetical protein
MKQLTGLKFNPIWWSKYFSTQPVKQHQLNAILNAANFRQEFYHNSTHENQLRLTPQ